MTRIYGHVGRWTTSLDPDALRAYTPPQLGAIEVASMDAFLAAENSAREDGLAIAVRGKPVWTRNGRCTEQPADCAAILAAYRERREKIFSELRGRFAIAILDAGRKQVLLAVDPMGIERMCWAVNGQGLVFSDSAEQVANFPGLRAPLRAQAIHDFLLLHMIPSPDTAFEGVRKLEPGRLLVFTEGRASVSTYWSPRFSESAEQTPGELKSGLHAALDAAVLGSGPDGACGAFLSGGLDSSSVAGVLGRVTGRPPATFTIGFGVESHDETRFARISARHFNCDAHEYNVTADDVVAAFDRIAVAYDEPFGNSSAVPTYFCAELAARSGVRHLLAGDGGDELFGGNERYGKQRIFEHYHALPHWLGRSVLEPMAAFLGDENPVMPLRKFASYVRQARITLPERLETWNLFYRTPPADIFEPEFAKLIQPRYPIELMSRVYGSVSGASLLNRMMHYDWHFTLADSDLRKVITMCELAGVDVSFPMLDPAVIDLSLRVPSAMKMRGGELRSFYKDAMTGFLPPEVLTKKKHGFGLPFGVWLKTHPALRELIQEHLRRLGGRGIVRRDFLDRMMEEHRNGDASYYGYAIWDFAMLESWLNTHRPRGI